MKKTLLLFLLSLTPVFAQSGREAPQINDVEAKTFKEYREQQNLLKRFPQDLRLTVSTLNGQEINASDRPILTFTKTGLRITGFGGCNTVGGDYRLTPRQIRFGNLSFTTKTCGEGTNKQEILIFKAIQFASHWKPVGHNSVTLMGRAGNITFVQAF
jgi:heat shock protein HslJ